jgi:phosphoribosylamine--glycine ligase
MKLLVLGGGGREHAIIKKLKENPKVEKIFAIPGNGGISYDAVCENIDLADLEKIAAFALEKNVAFAVVGPDDPLANGAVDMLTSAGIPAFGPNAAAAIIESSKVFSKDLMKKHNIPTADYQIFDNINDAISYIETLNRFPIVLKADGLALGKGVIIANNFKEAWNGAHNIMTKKLFGESGNKIVIEEYMTGPEVSVLAFTDSKTLIPMISSMDHKRAYDGGMGPNTGGMGTIAPNPYYTEDIADQCMREIYLPTMEAMNKEGRPFKGCLYFGLMLTESGPKVIEYNCRFGDPEAQVVLPLLKTDLLTIMEAVADERLSDISVAFYPGAACCVIAASEGYPGDYRKGLPIYGLNEGSLPDSFVFHAGTKLSEKGLVTSGGRVLGVSCLGETLHDAVSKSYSAISRINFEGIQYRKDIGETAINLLNRKG